MFGVSSSLSKKLICSVVYSMHLKQIVGLVWWLVPIIPAMWEAVDRRLGGPQFEASLGKRLVRVTS
jgi:hypothetical protein